MERRELLKGLGGAVGVATVGGIGVLATNSASATAGVSQEETISGQNDDGEVQFVGYGGKLTYEWDGLDTEAHYGQYSLETRIKNEGEDWSGWRHIGAQSGELGASWGGENDPDSGKGTQGSFTFRYGSQFGQRDYAIAYNDAVAASAENGRTDDYGTNGLLLVPENKSYATGNFEADGDGETETTEVQFRYTCSVLDSDENEIANSSATATASLTVNMTNEEAEVNTGNEVSGSIGDAE